MGRNREADGPSLVEAWAMLGARFGLQVESSREDSVRAQGQIRGRPVLVQIERQAARSEGWRFLAGINTVSSRNRRDTWRTALWVACANPSGVTGAIRSAVDVSDPAWTPGAYDPRAGRSVGSEPSWLAERVLDVDTHERLMSIMDDVTIHVTPTGVGIEEQGTSRPDSGGRYVAGSFVHHYQGPPPPWPERAIARPPWWIELLCDLADAVDRTSGIGP